MRALLPTSQKASSCWYPSPLNTLLDLEGSAVMPEIPLQGSTDSSILQQLLEDICLPPHRDTTPHSESGSFPLYKNPLVLFSFKVRVRTFVNIFPPREYPIAKSGLFGNVPRNHLTTCRISHVALAL